jgi:DNA polymerase III sliding clamp (beta) subunit (PCNA family)
VVPTNFRAEYTLSGNVDEELAKWITAHEVAVKIGDKKQPVAELSLTGGGVWMIASRNGLQCDFESGATVNACLEEFSVHYNAKYVLDALLAIRDFKPRSVSVKFAGNVSPFVFETDNGVLALILPIRTV